MADYALRLLSPTGFYLDTLDVFQSLDEALPANEVGALTLTLPPVYDYALFARDARIERSRKVGGLVERRLWLVRRPANGLSAEGARVLTITAFDPRDILRRRILTEPSQSVKTGPADDVMKAIVRESFTSATDTNRNLDSSLFTVAADVGAGPVITMELAGRYVINALRDLVAASITAGTYLAFDVVPDGDGFQFQTYIDVWGQDRREQVVLSAERGTLVDVEIESDWTEETTVVYARGRGEGDAALSALAYDSARIAASPFGRIETFVNASNATTTAQVQAEADAALAEGFRRDRFSARLQEQPGTRYGVEIGLGDIVTAEHEGTRYVCRVEPVRITLDENGKETLDVQLRNIE